MPGFVKQASALTEPLGVAHIAFSLQTGGMERLLVEFARRADRHRFQLNFFSLTGRGAPGDDIQALGWPVHCLGKASGFRWNVVRRLAAAFRRDGIRIVHTHNSGAMIYGAVAARLAGVPAVIHTRHGQRFGASRRQHWTFAAVSRLIDRVVGVSEDSAQQCIREGVPASRVRTIWNGIDLTRFAYHGSKAGGPAVLVARLVPEKDLPTLLQAVARLVRQEPAFRLQVVGDGPCMPEARQTIEQLGISEQVRLLGERRDVPDILREASLFVLPSRTEGISLTLLEAMASGLPVVATRVGGNAEVVQHGRTGWLVPAGDAVQLADAIHRCWRAPDESRRFGRSGRERVERHFDVDRMVGQYEDMYREILGFDNAHRNTFPSCRAAGLRVGLPAA